MNGRHAVYRCYAADGELLYVGETNWPKDRMRHHKRDKPWWPQVERIDIVWYGTYREALNAEAAGIASELPKWNKRGMPGWKADRKPRARNKAGFLLTTGQAAEVIGFHPRKVWQMAKAGDLPSTTMPGSTHRRILRTVAEAYRDKMAAEAGGE